MKKVNKLLSAVLSVVLCLGMIAPAFAADAYFYVEVKNPPVELDYSEPGTGTNNGWAFMGKGEVDDAIAEVLPTVDLSSSVTNNPQPSKLDGTLPDGYTAPTAGAEQTLTEGLYYDCDKNEGEQQGDDVISATVTAFHNIGQYQYDDGSSEVGEFTYTVTWDWAKWVTNTESEEAEARGGYNLDDSECTSVTTENGTSDEPNSGVICFAGPAIHVDGTATLHQNAVLQVVVQNYGQEDKEQDSGKYIRDTQKDDQDVVKGVADKVAELSDDCYDFDFTTEDGKVVATYTEKTYTVTYVANTDLNFDGMDAETYGKATEAWTEGMLKAALQSTSNSEGTYTFTGWNVTFDENGNVTIEAECTFTPYPPVVVPIPDVEIELEDEDIPLAGLLTRGDAIGYLWEQSGSPDAELSDFEDVPEDHEWAVAIGWAQANGIAVADLEGNFRPDDLILRSVEDIALSPEGELEQFLNRYAVYAGVELDADVLFVELEGDWDDIIMGEDAQVIFDDFFAKLELALAQAA